MDAKSINCSNKTSCLWHAIACSLSFPFPVAPVSLAVTLLFSRQHLEILSETKPDVESIEYPGFINRKNCRDVADRLAYRNNSGRTDTSPSQEQWQQADGPELKLVRDWQ
ncbi:hypothetical protein BJX64DRAFT_257303 [Aspergillus heterothallicus]